MLSAAEGKVRCVRPSKTVSMTMQNSTEPIELFLSYSHTDRAMIERLCIWLKPLVRQGVIAPWHDCMISPGTEWNKQISEHLNSSQIILLLVSSDFLASDFCYDIEMKRAMECHEKKEARVIPVILRPVLWEDQEFSKLQALPECGRPITAWDNEDDAFVNVLRGIRAAAKELQEARLTAPPPEPISRCRNRPLRG